mmetsp:Transcript_5538/g.8486  ORF Transcript_5538/g.8486 Transcript_5538/m.8486 type:complete len:483 (-) Transcript_5538:27-1475(-)
MHFPSLPLAVVNDREREHKIISSFVSFSIESSRTPAMIQTETKNSSNTDTPPIDLPSLPKSLSLATPSQKHSLARSKSEPIGDGDTSTCVKFHQIEIREYEQILADNPSVSCGPPLGLGWDYQKTPLVFSVEEYENYKGPTRRVRSEMIMPQHVREVKLKEEWQVPSHDIEERLKEIRQARQQRGKTIRNTDQVEQLISFFTTAKRRLKRIVYPTQPEERRLRKVINKTRRRVKSMNDLKMTRSVGSSHGVNEEDDVHDAEYCNDSSSEIEEIIVEEKEDSMRGFDDTFRIVYASKQRRKLLKKAQKGESFLSTSSHSAESLLFDIKEDQRDWFVGQDLDSTRAHHHKVLILNNENEDMNLNYDTLILDNDGSRRNDDTLASSSDRDISVEGDESDTDENGNAKDGGDCSSCGKDSSDEEAIFNPDPIEQEKFVPTSMNGSIEDSGTEDTNTNVTALCLMSGDMAADPINPEGSNGDNRCDS